jgi:hypothetical protein
VASLVNAVLYEEMEEEGLDLRSRLRGGVFKPPRGALAKECRLERRGKRRGKTASGVGRECDVMSRGTSGCSGWRIEGVDAVARYSEDLDSGIGCGYAGNTSCGVELQLSLTVSKAETLAVTMRDIAGCRRVCRKRVADRQLLRFGHFEVTFTHKSEVLYKASGPIVNSKYGCVLTICEICEI